MRLQRRCSTRARLLTFQTTRKRPYRGLLPSAAAVLQEINAFWTKRSNLWPICRRVVVLHRTSWLDINSTCWRPSNWTSNKHWWAMQRRVQELILRLRCIIVTIQTSSIIHCFQIGMKIGKLHDLRKITQAPTKEATVRHKSTNNHRRQPQLVQMVTRVMPHPRTLTPPSRQQIWWKIQIWAECHTVCSKRR